MELFLKRAIGFSDVDGLKRKLGRKLSVDSDEIGWEVTDDFSFLFIT